MHGLTPQYSTVEVDALGVMSVVADTYTLIYVAIRLTWLGQQRIPESDDAGEKRATPPGRDLMAT
jgi:hypothetical protein